MGKIRLLVADEQSVLRESLRIALDGDGGFGCVVAGDYTHCLKATREFAPDAVLVSSAILESGGPGAVRRIKTACPGTCVIVTHAPGEQSSVAALMPGVSGCVSNTATVDEMATVVRVVCGGGTIMDSGAALKKVKELDDSRTGELAYLESSMPRAIEILRLVAKGLNSRDIATRLDISERTVQSHLLNLFRRIGVRTRTQAVLHGVKQGWIDLDDLVG
ncbi:MAG: response regulator transcription factor [Dehalococcoidia bacterium]|nr:response regulator transcription factor [Dehalococcoidia bacterium]